MEPAPREPEDDVTKLLRLFGDYDPATRDDLVLALYEELRRIARLRMSGQRRDHTLQPTALANETYAKLLKLKEMPKVEDKTGFRNWATAVMANLLRDHARHKKAQKSGGKRLRISLDDCDVDPSAESEEGSIDILNAIDDLERISPEMAAIVKLWAHWKCTYAEIASELNVRVSRVEHQLRAARAWLRDRLDQ